MSFFHPVNALAVTRILRLILLDKNLIVFKLRQTNITKIKKSKDSKSVLIFFSGFSGCWVFSNVVTFHKIKVSKQMLYLCCHLVTESFSLIISMVCFKVFFTNSLTTTWLLNAYEKKFIRWFPQNFIQMCFVAPQYSAWWHAA